MTLLVLSAMVPAVAANGISIENPWMRLIIKARPAAGYFSLHNTGDRTVALTGASSSACGTLMLHQSKDKNGVATMRPVKSVPVPAHGSLAFAPGGYHLMCMQPQPDLVVGKSVTVTLTFDDGERLSAAFPVKGPGGQ